MTTSTILHSTKDNKNPLHPKETRTPEYIERVQSAASALTGPSKETFDRYRALRDHLIEMHRGFKAADAEKESLLPTSAHHIASSDRSAVTSSPTATVTRIDDNPRSKHFVKTVTIYNHQYRIEQDLDPSVSEADWDAIVTIYEESIRQKLSKEAMEPVLQLTIEVHKDALTINVPERDDTEKSTTSAQKHVISLSPRQVAQYFPSLFPNQVTPATAVAPRGIRNPGAQCGRISLMQILEERHHDLYKILCQQIQVSSTKITDPLDALLELDLENTDIAIRGATFTPGKESQTLHQILEKACEHLHEGSNTLFLHLQRVISTTSKTGETGSQKVKTRLEIPSLEPFRDPQTQDLYTLTGFAVHQGEDSMHTGHYVAYVRRGPDFYKCDDAHIPQMITETEFLTAAEQCTMACFEKVPEEAPKEGRSWIPSFKKLWKGDSPG